MFFPLPRLYWSKFCGSLLSVSKIEKLYDHEITIALFLTLSKGRKVAAPQKLKRGLTCGGSEKKKGDIIYWKIFLKSFIILFFYSSFVSIFMINVMNIMMFLIYFMG